jgi:hypothetical protein
MTIPIDMHEQNTSQAAKGPFNFKLALFTFKPLLVHKVYKFLAVMGNVPSALKQLHRGTISSDIFYIIKFVVPSNSLPPHNRNYLYFRNVGFIFDILLLEAFKTMTNRAIPRLCFAFPAALQTSLVPFSSILAVQQTLITIFPICANHYLSHSQKEAAVSIEVYTHGIM